MSTVLLIISLLLLGMILTQRSTISLLKKMQRKNHEEMTKLKIAYEQEKERARIDPLTKLYNRRMILRRYEEELSRLKRNNHNMFMFLIDLDNFKKINDNLGHTIGDKLLVHVGQILLIKKRIYDIAGAVGRYGGDEFVIFMSEITNEVAEIRANEILARINEIKIGNIRIEASIGLREVNKDDSFEDIIEKTDEALAEAKKSGKNKVVKILKHALK